MKRDALEAAKRVSVAHADALQRLGGPPTLTERLRKLADAHERLEQGGGASEELFEAADEIDLLQAQLRSSLPHSRQQGRKTTP